MPDHLGSQKVSSSPFGELVDTMQKELQWMLLRDGCHLCSVVLGIPFGGTAPDALSQDCFLLLLCLLMFVIAIVLLSLAWCDWAWGDSHFL